MGKIKGWRKAHDDGHNFVWRGEGYRSVAVYQHPRFAPKWKVNLPDENGQYHNAKERALKQATDYMRRHPNG